MAGTSGIITVCPPPASEGKRQGPRRFAWLVRGLCRWVLAVVFLMAGITKVTDLRGFDDEVLLHSGLPYSLGLVVAAVLPWLELTCAACLLAGYAVREASLLLVMLLTLLLAYSLLHLNESDCACFMFPRPQALMSWWWPPLRNSLLLLCGICAIWR
jgi:uncharacterized membrane protein YphA (DoxX/SURF4 family)